VSVQPDNVVDLAAYRAKRLRNPQRVSGANPAAPAHWPFPPAMYGVPMLVPVVWVPCWAPPVDLGAAAGAEDA
jgi:hypothetical protein